MPQECDAVVVGSGPNGLAAAITLAEAGCKTRLIEAHSEVGGGLRSAALTLPGFVHDVCAAILPLSWASPFFRRLPLEQYGLEWVFPPAALAHPLDDGPTLVVRRSVPRTAEQLGEDSRRYAARFSHLAARYEQVLEAFLAPPHLPRHPIDAVRFGLRGILPATTFAGWEYRGERARALFAGMAAHSILPLERLGTAAFGLMLSMLAHASGWPYVRGGSHRLAHALSSHFRALGGVVETGRTIASLGELPRAQVVLLDLTPRQLLRLAGEILPEGYRRRMAQYRYGPGVCKVDFALSGPIPWRDAGACEAATVHLGGTAAEIALSERLVWRGDHVERPFVILAQQSLFDSSRAPDGRHTAWAYAHVPHGSAVDVSARIEAQIERFAPGFRELVQAKHVYTASEMEAYNPNYVGGDINGGAQDLGQLFMRPVPSLTPYATPLPDVYLCSSSTPPGGGVHGMCGVFAAQAALRRLR